MLNDRFLRVCRGEAADAVPVWFMRQAGRSLPEYRSLRERHSILDVCRTPDLAVEATLQPVRRLGVDAAILFSDIVIPLTPIGIDLDIAEGLGPVIANPVRTAADVTALKPLDPDDLSYVAEAVSALVQQLDVPLIGFAGAPFTLASYLVEGAASKSHARTKALMLSEPSVWNLLMDALADAVITHLRVQVHAGASAIQLFDSWAGTLTSEDYRAFVAPHVKRILHEVEGTGVPTTIFGITTGELLGDMAATGATMVGVDWRVPLDEARKRVARDMPLQGNLDPAVCLAPWDVVADRASQVLEQGAAGPHVFNLGHGVLPETDPDILARLVEHVHGWNARG